MVYVFIVFLVMSPIYCHDLATGSGKGVKIFDEFIKASPAIWRQVENITVNATRNAIIDSIVVTDLRNEKDGEVDIVDGGIEKENVTIELKSPSAFRGYDFHVQVFASNKTEQDMKNDEYIFSAIAIEYNTEKYESSNPTTAEIEDKSFFPNAKETLINIEQYNQGYSYTTEMDNSNYHNTDYTLAPESDYKAFPFVGKAKSAEVMENDGVMSTPEVDLSIEENYRPLYLSKLVNVSTEYSDDMKVTDKDIKITKSTPTITNQNNMPIFDNKILNTLTDKQSSENTTTEKSDAENSNVTTTKVALEISENENSSMLASSSEKYKKEDMIGKAIDDTKNQTMKYFKDSILNYNTPIVLNKAENTNSSNKTTKLTI